MKSNTIDCILSEFQKSGGDSEMFFLAIWSHGLLGTMIHYKFKKYYMLKGIQQATKRCLKSGDSQFIRNNWQVCIMHTTYVLLITRVLFPFFCRLVESTEMHGFLHYFNDLSAVVLEFKME